MEEKILELTDLRKQYGTFSLDCSLSVLPGRITGLIGRNGAGKSTTFKAILNLIQPDSGRIEIFGMPHTKLRETDREQLGVVLPDSGFSDSLTVKDVAAILRGMYSGFDREGFLQKCRRFGLPEKKRIREFSTGMRAKLKLLSAISHGAKLLILDEPTSGLDVVAREELLELLQDYLTDREERSVLISSHISGDLEKFCDDIYMIHDGRIALHEETDVLLSDYGLIKADENTCAALDGTYLLKQKREKFGYSLLTNQRQYYLDNYPGLTVEKGSIDGVIRMITTGEELYQGRGL